MLYNLVFGVGYSLKRPGVIPNYRDFQETQWLPFQQLKNGQEQQLARLIEFAYNYVPYYSRLFSTLGLTAADVSTIEDLEKLPVLTKQVIKENWQDFIPKNIDKLKYLDNSTTGSTGKPLQFRISTNDWEKGFGLLYRGWGYAGYELGDKVSLIWPDSHIPTWQYKLVRMFRHLVLNFRSYSTSSMGPESLQKYFNSINSRGAHFIRGSPSAILIFAQFIRDNNLKLESQLKAVFTGTEMLFSGQRKVIEEVFNVPVFDHYGLKDGGISAYECEEHCGKHIDMERAILETVDEESKQTINQEGRILATSLYNYALPFIRYDTGDEGTISDSGCACGRKTALLKGLLGRTSDTLKLGNVSISNSNFGGILGNVDIEQYQIIQEDPYSITFRIIKGKTYQKRDEVFIEKWMKGLLGKHVGKASIQFDYVDSIPFVIKMNWQ